MSVRVLHAMPADGSPSTPLQQMREFLACRSLVSSQLDDSLCAFAALKV
jgi:hypothetical protein